MKKEKKIQLRVSHTEYSVIKQRANRSGCPSVSEYLRNTALGCRITYKLTPDELESYLLLNKFSDNFRRIGNLFRKGDTTGVKEHTIETSKLIQQHLNKLK